MVCVCCIKISPQSYAIKIPIHCKNVTTPKIFFSKHLLKPWLIVIRIHQRARQPEPRIPAYTRRNRSASPPAAVPPNTVRPKQAPRQRRAACWVPPRSP